METPVEQTGRLYDSERETEDGTDKRDKERIRAIIQYYSGLMALIRLLSF
jgi:hypothetical protein